MNARQKAVLLVGMVVLVGMGVFPPYVKEEPLGQIVTYAPIFSPPQDYPAWTLDMARLGVQALVGIVAFGGLVLLLGSGSKINSS